MIKRFITDSGVSMDAIDVAAMRRLDQLAVDSTGPNLFQMMENAGRNLAELTLQILGDEWRRASVTVLAGGGGNGGGGLCAGRHLRNHGLKVNYALADEDHLSEVTVQQLRLLRTAGAAEIKPAALGSLKSTVILDAVIGYSLSGAPRGVALDLIRWANSAPGKTISLDIPSGIDADSGKAPGEHITADATLTLAWPKKGLLPEQTGRLWLGDIGIPAAVYIQAGINFAAPFDRRYLVPLSAV